MRKLSTSGVVFLGLAAASVAACSTPSLAALARVQGPRTIVFESPVVEIPIDLSTRHVALEVFVDGQGPFPFNLDTYAVTTACVDLGFAERMGFEKVGQVWNSDGSGKHVQRDIVLVPELRVGGVTFTDVRALADDYSWVPTSEGGSIDGLLGYHLFRDLLLEIDYPRQRVILREGVLSAEDPHTVWHDALRQRPDLPLQVGDQRLIVGIDSGASSAIALPESFLDRLELLEPATVVGRAKTVYSEEDVLTGVLSEALILAGHEHERVKASFSVLFGKPLIGHELLSQYSVTFDQRNGRVRFALPEQPRDSSAD